MSQKEHLVTLSEDWIAEGIAVSCSCGWDGGTFVDRQFAEGEAQRHYLAVKEPAQ
jgi:hypothetical protein